MTEIAAIAFDKDGTLFDFRQTWAGWTGAFIREIAAPFARVEVLAEAARFDLAENRHLPDSPFIAGTLEEYVAVIAGVLPELTADDIRGRLRASTAQVTQVPATPLLPLMEDLRAAGYPMGVVTNDGERLARGHLAQAGIDGHFSFVAGFDSGYGGKPAPGMLLACAEALGHPPERVLVVGDSRHDLDAAAAAGMPALAVLTGYASEDDLAPHALAVLPHVGHLPGWLEARNATGGMSQTAMP